MWILIIMNTAAHLRLAAACLGVVSATTVLSWERSTAYTFWNHKARIYLLRSGMLAHIYHISKQSCYFNRHLSQRHHLPTLLS